MAGKSSGAGSGKFVYDLSCWSVANVLPHFRGRCGGVHCG